MASEDIPRNFKSRLLKSNLPKPNVVRIELLTSHARRRYMGAVQDMITSLQAHVGENMNRMQILKNKVFYGLLKHGADQSIGMSAGWETSTDMAKLFTAVKNVAPELAGKVADKVKSGTGEVVEKVVSTGIEAVGVVNDLLNISTTATGSASVQKFSSITVNDYSVEVGWYLPEQLELCKRSLKILYQMIYPSQVDATQMGKVFTGANTEELLEKLDTSIINGQGDPPNLNKSRNTDGIFRTLGTAKDMLITGAGELAGAVLNPASSTFGHNLTFDPLPVRVSIGAFIDIEPLVINKIATTFSTELFVAKDGKQLPVFATTTIGFKMWMNPRPDMQWLKLLGTELFGEDDPKPETPGNHLPGI